MNAIKLITNNAPRAKRTGYPLAADLSAVRPGHLVMVRPTKAVPTPAAEGACVVVDVVGDKFSTFESWSQPSGLIWVPMDLITHHLPGVTCLHDGKGYRIANGPNDANLIAIGDQLETLLPQAQALWASCNAIGANMSDQKRAVSRTYQAALDRFGPIGDAVNLLCWAVNFMGRATTPAGHAVRLQVMAYDFREGFDIVQHDLDMVAAEALDIAKAVAAPALPQGTLADLMARYADITERLEVVGLRTDPLELAFREWQRKAEPTTPARVRDGRVVCAIVVTGEEADDLDRIGLEHARWRSELCLNKMASESMAAANLLEAVVTASHDECVRLYREQTVPAFPQLVADYLQVKAEFQQLCDDQMDAMTAIASYRPTSLQDVAAMARYLTEGCGDVDLMATLLATLRNV